MRASLKIIFTLFLAVVFLGCSGPQKTTVPPKMMAELNEELGRCQAERKALAREAVSLNEQLDALKKDKPDAKKLESENLALTLKVKELNEQLEKTKKDAAIAAIERKLDAEKPPGASTKRSASLNLSQASAKSKARIKVLSGDGQMSSAKQISASLSSMGYRVAKVDKAGRTDFKRTTVYYAPDVKSDAMDIAGRLNAEARALTWKSEFNIIIVSGRQ